MRARKNPIILSSDSEIIAKIEEGKAQGFKTSQMAVGYARVSTTKDEQRASREDQVERCHRYMKEEGLFPVAVYECSESAKKTGRVVFNEIIRVVNEYEIGHWVVKNYRRFSRNMSDKEMINTIIANKKKLTLHYYLTHEKLDPKSDTFVSDLLTLIAAKENKDLSVNIKDWHNEMRAKGIATNLPVGLRHHRPSKDAEPDSEVVEIDPEFEKPVSRIFEMYLYERTSIPVIVEELKGQKTREGYDFHKGTVWSILTNPIFAGKQYRRRKLDEDGNPTKEWDYIPLSKPFDGYITEDEHEEVLRLCADNSSGSKKRRENPYPLFHFVKCVACGRIMSGQTTKNKSGVPKYVNYQHECGLVGKSVYSNQKYIFDAMDRAMSQMTFNADFTRERLIAILKNKGNVAKTAIGECQENIKRWEKMVSMTYDDLQDARMKDKAISADALKIKLAEYRKLIDREKEKVKTAEDAKNLMTFKGDATEIIEAIHHFAILYPQARREEKIKLMKSMANWLVYDVKTGKADILWRKPFNYLLDKRVELTPSQLDSREEAPVIGYYQAPLIKNYDLRLLALLNHLRLHRRQR